MRDLFPAGATIPVWPVTEEGRCGCGWRDCKRPGKHADAHAPTDSPAYAVITGARSGIVVVDIDRKPGAADGLAQFDALMAGTPLPEGLAVDTPANGLHLYYQHPGCHVGNGKLASAIDVRGDEANDGGFAYVIGPGSPGYVRTSDPCVVTPADPYSVAPGESREIPALPERLLGLLLMRGTEKKQGFAPTPVDVDTDEGERRIALGQAACESMPASQADGQAGMRLFNVCLRLVRGLELPVEVAGALVVEYFNPRCTQTDGVTPYPWSDDDIEHKLEDARDKSDLPCGGAAGDADAVGLAAVVKAHATPPIVRGVAAGPRAAMRKTHDPAHAYTFVPGELQATSEPNLVPFSELSFAMTRGNGWDGCWQFDTFGRRIVCINPPIRLDAETSGLSDRDLANIRIVLEYNSMKASKEDVYAAILAAASAVEFHPVREYFAALPTDADVSILSGLAERLFGTTEPMANVFLRKFLISAVRRVLSPGCKVDTMLVLYGKQGFKKSTCLEVLFGSRYFKDDLADLESKDAAIGLVGRLLVEVAELDKILRAETSTVKAFLSRRVDRYRPPYGKVEVDIPRECVFVGTTNEEEFQRDHTGGRRFWPIHVAKRVDVAWLEANRDAIWAAAHVLASSGEAHWLTDDDEGRADVVREDYTELDTWHAVIEEACRGKEWVRVDTLYSDVINKGGTDGLLRLDRKTMLRITATLKRLGCIKRMVQEGDARVRAWVVPDEIRSQHASKSGAARMARVIALHANK